MLKDKGLFLKAETQTALWLPWDTVGQLIGDKMEKLLQMTFHVRAEYRDADYRYCEFLFKLVDCLEKCLIYGHIRRFAN